jgi:xanthine dehydrogenase accessory factor
MGSVASATVYSVALSVAACLRAGTDVLVAWIVHAEGLPDLDPTDAVALTPGGGRMGSLASGALDSHLGSIAKSATGALVSVRLSDVDALIAGLPAGGHATLAVVPADRLPDRLWGLLLERRPLALVAARDGSRLTSISVHTADGLGDADDPVRGLLAAGRAVHQLTDERLVPVPRLAISGGGPNAQALEDAARLLGWQVSRSAEPDVAIGLMAGLSPIDAAVVMGHDVESSSRVLGAALESGAGYIGSLGSATMQQHRADWLAYQGITDLGRVHGPAGIDIAARTPAEIAISILAEAIAVLNRTAA